VLALFDINHADIHDEIILRSKRTRFFKSCHRFGMACDKSTIDGFAPSAVGGQPHGLTVNKPICGEYFYDHIQTPAFAYCAYSAPVPPIGDRFQAAIETELFNSASALSIAAPATASPMTTMTGPDKSSRCCSAGKSFKVPWNMRLFRRLAFSITATAVSSCRPAKIRRSATDAATDPPISTAI